jgi:hypothetical protein
MLLRVRAPVKDLADGAVMPSLESVKVCFENIAPG